MRGWKGAYNATEERMRRRKEDGHGGLVGLGQVGALAREQY